MQLIKFLSNSFLIMVVSVIVLQSLSRVKILRFLKHIASFIFGTLVIELILGLLGFYVYLMGGTSFAVYSLSKVILDRLIIHELAIYFAFVITLIFTAYFLDYIGVGILKGMKRISGSKTRYDMSSGYKKIVKLLQPKLWIYFSAALFTCISSIEGITQLAVVSSDTWNELKPYLFEALVTFIALDTFISLMQAKKNLIIELKILLLNFVTEIIQSIDKKTDLKQLKGPE